MSPETVCWQGWRIKLDETVISQVGVGIVVEPDPTVGQNFEDLGDMLSVVKDIAIEFDMLMPFVVAVEGLGSYEEAHFNLFRRLQEYHRGKFFLLPGTSQKADNEKLLGTLLNKYAVDISSFVPPTPLGLSQFWLALEQDERLNNAFGQLLNGWKNIAGPVTSSPERTQAFWQKKWKKLLLGETERLKQPAGTSHQDRESIQPARIEPPKSFCSRIVAARISNFKGLKECPSRESGLGWLDLDADIILVSGANGNGKSSFVEALSLGLTGYHPAWKPSGSKEHFFFFGQDNLKIELTLKKQWIEEGERFSNNSEKNLIICRNKDGSQEGQKKDFLSILRGETGTERGGQGGKHFYVPLNEQLHYRMTTYLPEHVDMLFDENVDPEVEMSDDNQDPELSRCMKATEEINTIRHIFPALSPEIEALCKAAEEQQRRIKDELDRLITTIENLENYSSLYEEAKEFFANLQICIWKLPVENAKAWQTDHRWQDMPAGVDGFISLLEKEKKSLQVLFGGQLVSWLRLGDMVDHYRKITHGSGNIQKKKDELESDIWALTQKVQELKGKIEEPEIRSETVQNLSSFYRFLIDKQHVLIKELNDWSDRVKKASGAEPLKLVLAEEAEFAQGKKHEPSVRVKDLAEEIENLDIDRLKRAKGILDVLLGLEQDKFQEELRETEKILVRKRNELTSYRENATETVPFDEIKNFLSAAEKQNLLFRLNNFNTEGKKYNELLAQRDSWQEEKNNLEELGKFIQKQREKDAGNDLSLRVALEKTFSNVLRRFSLTQGVEKITVTPQFQIKVDADKDEEYQRNVQCLSSGQKAQLAMAWMIACRELMQSEKNREFVHFPHRILIMDDPSTTFDTTNLLSQAILWRQLAYNPDSARRYQVFIVSHHEEFSSHLLDLLCPPPGHSMRLLKFVDWKRKEGAKLKLYDVEPSPLSFFGAGGEREQGQEGGMEKAKRAFVDALKTLREMV